MKNKFTLSIVILLWFMCSLFVLLFLFLKAVILTVITGELFNNVLRGIRLIIWKENWNDVELGFSIVKQYWAEATWF